MNIKVVLLVIASFAINSSKCKKYLPTADTDTNSCEYSVSVLEYLNAYYNFFLTLISSTISTSDVKSFVYSPTSIWLTLAAIAEGAEPTTREQLFQYLRMPKEPCTRQNFYKFVTTSVSPGDNVILTLSNTLVVDEALTVNPYWKDLVTNQSLLKVVDLPIKSDAERSIKQMEKILSAPLEGLNLTGNSVLLDTVEFEGLWTSAFADADVERAPFYDERGKHTGYVDLMRIKKRVRIVEFPNAKGKIIGLPMGTDGRYNFLFAMTEVSAHIKAAVAATTLEMVHDVVGNFKETEEPIDIAIPRISMTSVVDVRRLLTDERVQSLSNDEAASRFVSQPAALPTSIVQRATISLNTAGVSPPTGLETSSITLGEGFIANRPFLAALFDTKTFTCLITLGYAEPTYPI